MKRTFAEGNNNEYNNVAYRSSTSFEHIYLQKINKANAKIKWRRKIDSNRAVFTSSEYFLKKKIETKL